MLEIDAYVVSHLAIVEANAVVVSKDFLYYWLCRYDVIPHARNKAYPSLSLSDIKSFEIPVPPLDEQRRIVACIEELTERVDAARRLRAEAAEESCRHPGVGARGGVWAGGDKRVGSATPG